MNIIQKKNLFLLCCHLTIACLNAPGQIFTDIKSQLLNKLLQCLLSMQWGILKVSMQVLSFCSSNVQIFCKICFISQHLLFFLSSWLYYCLLYFYFFSVSSVFSFPSSSVSSIHLVQKYHISNLPQGKAFHTRHVH